MTVSSIVPGQGPETRREQIVYHQIGFIKTPNQIRLGYSYARLIEFLQRIRTHVTLKAGGVLYMPAYSIREQVR